MTICRDCGVNDDDHDYEQLARHCWPAVVARLREAMKIRIRAGHNDTCEVLIESDTAWPCTCGHDALVREMGH